MRAVLAAYAWLPEAFDRRLAGAPFGAGGGRTVRSANKYVAASAATASRVDRANPRHRRFAIRVS
jgi:hypothetical protein